MNEAQPVKIIPYRYTIVQKNELKKLIAEMLQTGIIRNNNSSFASLVVLIRKKMGHEGFV